MPQAGPDSRAAFIKWEKMKQVEMAPALFLSAVFLAASGRVCNTLSAIVSLAARLTWQFNQLRRLA
jgi:hypothetical protein